MVRETSALIPEGYPRHLERLFRLPDHHYLIIRPVVPADSQPLREAFARLSPAEIRARFFGSHRLTEKEIQTITEIDYAHRMHLVFAETLPPGDATIFGSAQAIASPGSHAAEFAVLVASHFSRMGVGTALLEQIFCWAEEQNLECVYGFVQDDNVSMRRLAEKVGLRSEATETPDILMLIKEL